MSRWREIAEEQPTALVTRELNERFRREPPQSASETAPATASATGTAGDLAYDATYFYVCVAPNTWKRAALSSF